MTQKNVNQPSRKLLPRLLLAQGLGWLGGVGVLTSGVALAQNSASETAIPAPTADSVEPPAAARDEIPRLEVAPESFAPESSPQVLPEVHPARPTVNLQPSKSNSASYDAPSSIVLSERSTGCQSTLPTGQRLSSGPCGTSENHLATTPASAIGSAASVRVGALNVAPVGVSLGTSAAVQDYYKRTVRPAGRLGNGNIRLIFPLSIPAPISSLFGWRIHPITGEQRFHSGTDLAAPLGTPVLAAYAGKVAIADFLGGYGLAVTLDHNKGTQQTLYGHLSEIFVKPGESVKQGDVIGRVGSTGNSTGPHLHFEFRQLTSEGWVAMDAGAQLEYAMAQLIKSLQVAQKSQTTKS